MKFIKMNGAGNDFIIINNIEEKIKSEKFPRICQILCERHLSIGADGIMVIDLPRESGDFRMTYYNRDGSEGEMCGNGARCICRYGYEFGLAGEKQSVETKAGMVTGVRKTARQYTIRLNDISKMILDYSIIVDGVKYECSYVELGNPGLPHAVIEYPNLKDTTFDQLMELGRKMRYNKAFPKGANVNFYDVIGKDHIIEKTYERGVEDFTYACGTGTGSMIAVLTYKNKVSGNHVKVDVPGGELFITVDKEDDKVKNLFLTGPTNIVAIGVATDEELFTNFSINSERSFK